ncbi:MAG: hypothetical protein AB9833_07500 [Bacteroidales bacterium]
MAIRKIKYFWIILTGIIFSCNTNSNNSESILKEKESEISRKDAILSQMKDDVIYQDKVITEIQNSLDTIGLLSNSFKIDIESGKNVEADQSEEIFRKINLLKEYINTSDRVLRNLKLENIGLINLISRFKVELENKEKEIITLQNKVKEQEGVIEDMTSRAHEQEFQNKELEREISQNKALAIQMREEMKEDRANFYYALGGELESIANELPQIKGWFTKETKQEIEKLKFEMRIKSYSFYTKAKENGHSQAYRRMQSLQYIIPSLR